MQTQVESLAAITRLQEAAINGDVPCLHELLRTYPRILDMQRCCLAQSPLHVALELGHFHFAKMMLDAKPMLAEDQFDQAKRSPLHISSAKGQLNMVKMLVSMNPSMCFARDHEGRNPAHVAAMKGHKEVVDVLIGVTPQAVQERTIQEGETVLHLSLKYGQVETFKFLLLKECVGDNLLNSKDNNGNTVLHLAVAHKQYEIVELLLNKKGIEKKAINIGGMTAMDVCLLGSNMDENSKKILKKLKSEKALRAKDALSKLSDKPHAWIKKQRNALMVVASLIATMAFQFGVNPPGGVWQDDNGHHAGASIMDSKDSGSYRVLLIVNTIGLVSSLSVILLLISGLPDDRITMMALMIAMWIAISTTTFAFLRSVSGLIIRPSTDVDWLSYTFMVWSILMALLLIAHIIRLFAKLIKKLIHGCKKVYLKSGKPNHPHPQTV